MRTWLTSLPRTDKRRRNKKSAALARQNRQRRGLEWLEQRVLLASDLQLSELVAAYPNALSTSASAVPGDMVNYHITISNTSGATVGPVTITDTLPSQVTFISASPSSGSASETGGVVTATIPSIAAGQSAFLQVKATPNASSTTAVTDSITASDASGPVTLTGRPVTINAAGSSAVQDLVVTKTATATTGVLEGQEINFTVTVHNTDTANTAHNVVISDVLPAGEDYLNTEQGSDGVFKLSGKQLTDTIGDVAPGATVSATYDVLITKAGTLTDTATATTSSGITTASAGDNVKSLSITTAAAPNGANLAVTKTPSPTTVAPGQDVTYTVIVANNGTVDAHNVELTDLLPEGMNYVSSIPAAGSGSIIVENGSVVDEIGTLGANGGAATLTIVASPDASLAGQTVTNQACATTTTGDTDPTDNCGFADVTVSQPGTGAANVSIAKSGPATGTVGQPLTYTIAVTNHGASAATNVTVTDISPIGETVNSTSDSGGGTVTQNGNVLSETIASLAAGATDTITVVVTPNQAGTFTDTAAVSVPAGNSNSTTTSSVTTVVTAAAAPNVSIAKTGPATATVGTGFDYTVTVTNSGTAAASNVTVTDTLPSQVTFVSATDSQGGTITESGGVVTDVISSLPVGVDTITIHVNPTTAGTATNTASVTVSGNIGSPTSASVTTTVSVAAAPNVSIAKTGPANATVGTGFDYTVTVTNSGTAAASNVTVTDTLPSQVAFVSATDTQGGTITESGGVVTDVISSLPVGVDTITIHVNPTTAGTAANTASVSVSGNTGSPTSASVTTVIAAATGVNVSIAKTGPANATAGTTFNYTLTVANNASSAASNITVSDTLPSGILLVSATDNQGGVISVSGGHVTDVIASLGAGATDTIVLHVLPTAAGAVTNTASVAVTGNTSNQTQSSVTTTVGAATGTSVSIIKTGPATGTVGAAFDYVLTVVNSGTAAASNVTVADTLPSGITLSTSTDSQGGTITTSGSSFTDVIGSLPAGATDTITLHVTPTAAGTFTNTATVTVTGNTSNQTSSSVTTVVSAVTSTNVSVTKTGPATATVGALLSYTITVTNNGAAAASNIVANDTLPSGVTFVSASDNRGGSITESGGVVTDTIASLAAGATDTITLNVMPTAAGSITNTATVTVTGNTSGHTSSSVTTTVSSVSGAANVSVTKSGPGTATVGQALTYTIVITNNGSSAASNVAFTDNLPASLTSISATDSLGGTVTVSGNSLTETIGALGAGASDTITVTATPTQTGTIVNTAVITVPSGNSGQGSSSVTTTIGSTQITGHTCFENGQPGDGTDLTFIRNLYRELLGRDPDPSGQQAWLNFLETGNPNQSGNGHSTPGQRHVVIDDFLSSPEYRNHLVTCMYENFLGRQADNSGLQFFVGQLNQGVDEERVLSEIVGSQEYFADAGGTSQGFVNALYRDIMGRQADAGGLAYWTGQANLNNVSRDQFVREFLGTPEAEHKLLNANFPGAPGATGAPGTPAGGTYALADLTGGGWENLFFQGSFLHGQDEAHNDFFAKLQAFTPYDDVIEDMLETQHYYDAPQGD